MHNHRGIVSFGVLASLLMFGALLPAPTGFASVWTVVNTSDSGTGSLRQAIADAVSGDSIGFAAGVTGTLTLLTGEILLVKNLNISGPGAQNLAISGNNSNRVFEVGTNVTVNISGLTIRDGHAPDGANGTSGPPSIGGDGTSGGGIYNRGALFLNDCIVSGNASGSGGIGGDYNSSAFAAQNGSLLSLSTADVNSDDNSFSIAASSNTESGGNGGNGGGIYNAGVLTLSNCTFSSNSSGNGGGGGQGGGSGGDGGLAGSGGAIFNAGTVVLNGCILTGNLTGSGGSGGSGFSYAGIPGTGGAGAGIYSMGTLSVVSCVFMANHGGEGGDGGSKSGGASDGARGGDGAGIWSLGEMSVTLSAFTGNSSGNGGASGAGHFTGFSGGRGGHGGGIYNDGILEVMTSTFNGNIGGDGGGGGVAIDGGPGGTGGAGGGIHNEGMLTLESSTLNGNRGGNGGIPNNGGAGGDGGDGGGICNTGEVTVVNCTFSGNSSGNGAAASAMGQGFGNGGNGGSGGGLYNAGTVTLVFCTVVTNASGYGGAAGNQLPGTDGSGGGVLNAAAPTSFQAVNTIFALNSMPAGGSGPDVSGGVDSLGHNLVGIIDGSSGFGAAGDQNGTGAAPLDPLLGPLEDNGGPTLTHALRKGSPALDAGDDAAITNYDLTTDQRGEPRLSGPHVDIGAVEVSLPDVQTKTPTAIDVSTTALHGAINPDGYPTGGFFEWGTTTNYENATAVTNVGAGTEWVNVTATLTGLVDGVLYHFRAAASNGFGTAYGLDFRFTTTDSDGDGISDVWTQQYFGHPTGSSTDRSRAQDDADGTGQNNLFKYVAGLDPTNQTSRFVLNILAAAHTSTQENLVFAPAAEGRAYSVEFSTNLTSGVWSALPNFTGPFTNGNKIIVIDLNATERLKLYRIRISRP